MKFPPTYLLPPACTALLNDISVLDKAYEYIRPKPEILLHIRRTSLLKSSIYSARIEGNPLVFDEAMHIDIQTPVTESVREVSNLLRAYEKLDSLINDPVTPKLLTTLHADVLAGLSSDAGRFRREESAIYNTSGIALYIAPAPSDVGRLVEDLCTFINTSSDPPLVVSAVVHIWFEKIHPFLDGNGRVGRLLSSLITKRSKHAFGDIVALEEYLENHKSVYYDALKKDTQDVTAFVEFFLFAVKEQIEITFESLKYPPRVEYPHLLPRRAEIVSIIRDHKTVTFDFLSRRFRTVAKRTLHYDLQQLVKGGYVVKRGSTRGTIYTTRD